MNAEHLKRQEIFKRTPEEKALVKKLKSEYKKRMKKYRKRMKNEPKKG